MKKLPVVNSNKIFTYLIGLMVPAIMSCGGWVIKNWVESMTTSTTELTRAIGELKTEISALKIIMSYTAEQTKINQKNIELLQKTINKQ